MGDTRVRIKKGDRERRARRWGLVEELLASTSSQGSNRGELGGGELSGGAGGAAGVKEARERAQKGDMDLSQGPVERKAYSARMPTDPHLLNRVEREQGRAAKKTTFRMLQTKSNNYHELNVQMTGQEVLGVVRRAFPVCCLHRVPLASLLRLTSLFCAPGHASVTHWPDNWPTTARLPAHYSCFFAFESFQSRNFFQSCES